MNENVRLLQYNLANGKRATFRFSGVRETEAEKTRVKIEDLVTSLKTEIKPDKETQNWLLKSANMELIEQLESLGLCDQCQEVLDERFDRNRTKAITVSNFVEWYADARKGDTEPSTLRKIKSSLNQLREYLAEHESIQTVDQITTETAFRFQLHRKKDKATTTVAKDVKVCKTAFTFAMKAGKVLSNPFSELKAGSEVNLDGQFILPITDYERLIEACPNSTWRVIIALGRIGGLREPSELVGLKWEHVNWHTGKILITSPKTKRYGKAQREIPLFQRLEIELREHWELTGKNSEYVIDDPKLRTKNVNLRKAFHSIREKAGVPVFPNPFRNLRLSAANDLCRLEGITTKTVTEWFGHDITTALKHYHRVMESDFQLARQGDPFADRSKSHPKKGDVKSDVSTPENGVEQGSREKKSPAISLIAGHKCAHSDPYGVRTQNRLTRFLLRQILLIRFLIFDRQRFWQL